MRCDSPLALEGLGFVRRESQKALVWRELQKALERCVPPLELERLLRIRPRSSLNRRDGSTANSTPTLWTIQHEPNIVTEVVEVDAEARRSR